jgi:hypothetical protein
MVAQRSSRTYWRVRRCPACGHTNRASAFHCLDVGPSWNADGPMRRECPECGHQAATFHFTAVREAHGGSAGSWP